MASDVEARKLHSLRVTDLRNELGKRNLDSKGVKNELVDRLVKALVSEGHDPETFLFDVEQIEKKTARSSKRRTIGEGDTDKEDNSIHESSFSNEDDVKESKEAAAEDGTEEAVSNENESAKQGTECGKKVEEQDPVTADVEVKTVESIKTEAMEESPPEADKCAVVKAPENKVIKEESLDKKTTDKNDVPKEQRISVSKKSVIEDSKEKPDVNKEDVEDSINLTIGEDEVKLFGEEVCTRMEESSQDKDGKENQPKNTITEEKDQPKAVSKNEQDNKQDVKPAVKKPVAKVNGSSRNLWVSGLSSMTRATDLKTLFSKYGKVVAAKIVTNAKTPGSRCYGYVTMLSAEDATISMQNLHKTELSGRMILVERAKDDGTGPARPKTIKKEIDKKKSTDLKDEKKVPEDKKKPLVKDEKKVTEEKKKPETEAKFDEKKNENKGTSLKDNTEDVNGDAKSGSVKSEKIRSRSNNRSSKSRERAGQKAREHERNRARVLTFAQIKEERDRHRLREKERALRLEEKRRQVERERQREIERRQREEATRLERERIKLKMEREKIERDKAELLKMERETQRLERERLQREKEELRRAQMKLEETRRAVKRPLEITRKFEDDRKRRPPSPDRRHVHVTSSSTARKELPSRSNGNRRVSPAEYVSSRRAYESSSSIEPSRKDTSSHSTRDKPGKESSRYDHHSYSGSHGADDVRSKDVRHRYPDPPSKSSGKESSRYDRPVDNWPRTSSSISSVKQFSSMGSSGGASLSSRDAWGSSDRKSDAPPPWSRSTTSTSDRHVPPRWPNSSTSTSNMNMSRSGPMSGSSAMFGSSGNYSDTMPSMGIMGITSGPSYSDRFDAYKSNVRKY